MIFKGANPIFSKCSQNLLTNLNRFYGKGPETDAGYVGINIHRILFSHVCTFAHLTSPLYDFPESSDVRTHMFNAGQGLFFTAHGSTRLFI